MKLYLGAMTGLSMATNQAIAREFPWGNYHSFADIGTAQGGLPVQVALNHPHLEGTGLDFSPVRSVFEDYISSFGLDQRLRFQESDYRVDTLPAVDVLVMGHSHLEGVTRFGPTLVVNPGSATLPRNLVGVPGTVGILEIAASGRCSVEIVKLG